MTAADVVGIERSRVNTCKIVININMDTNEVLSVLKRAKTDNERLASLLLVPDISCQLQCFTIFVFV